MAAKQRQYDDSHCQHTTDLDTLHTWIQFKSYVTVSASIACTGRSGRATKNDTVGARLLDNIRDWDFHLKRLMDWTGRTSAAQQPSMKQEKLLSRSTCTLLLIVLQKCIFQTMYPTVCIRVVTKSMNTTRLRTNHRRTVFYKHILLVYQPTLNGMSLVS